MAFSYSKNWAASRYLISRSWIKKWTLKEKSPFADLPICLLLSPFDFRRLLWILNVENFTKAASRTTKKQVELVVRTAEQYHNTITKPNLEGPQKRDIQMSKCYESIILNLNLSRSSQQLELELLETQMITKPNMRADAEMRVRFAQVKIKSEEPIP